MLIQIDTCRSRNGILFTMAAAGAGFVTLAYRNAAFDKRNSGPGNYHVRTERSGEHLDHARHSHIVWLIGSRWRSLNDRDAAQTSSAI